MKCIENLKRVNYTPELVMSLVKLYRFKGKDFYYEGVLKAELAGIIRTTVEKDTLYATKLLNLSVNENRLKSLIKGSAQPKTHDEQIVANLKWVFTLIQDKGDEIELTDNEFLRLAEKVFSEDNVSFGYRIVEVQVNILTEKQRVSKREDFKKEITLYKDALRDETHEPTQLITNLYIDILNYEIYNKHNDFLCLLVMYCLLFRERFNVFKYASFFEMYYERLDDFKYATAKASHNWELGFSETDTLNTLTINMLLDGYEIAENRASGAKIDKKLKKIDNVEFTILKLGQTFTREDIKAANPNFSDSTINRALKNLKDQNKVRPLGTGRTAAWMRIAPDELFGSYAKQVSLFDLMEGNDEEED